MNEVATETETEKERKEKRRRLTKILGNSKNLTNEEKAAILKRCENGEKVNNVKANAISKAKELAKLRKNKEETNRLEREKEEAERYHGRAMEQEPQLMERLKQRGLGGGRSQPGAGPRAPRAGRPGLP